MKLVYYHDATGNFGDDLNPWLWDRLLPGFFDGRDDVLFLGIGTILRTEIPAAPIKLVFGSGIGYGTPPELDDRWRFYCVRGPLTAERLGLAPELAVTDGAALVARVFETGKIRRRGTGFMPHHESATLFDWKSLCRRLGIRYLDPADGVDDLLRGIAGCELVLAEAMHAAIVADALRVPWTAVTTHSHINQFKWNDWCASLDLTYDPVAIEPLRDNSRQQPIRRMRTYLRRVSRTRSPVRQGRPPLQVPSPPEMIARAMARFEAARDDTARRRLSSDAMIASRITQLADQLERLRSDWKR